MLRSVTKLVLVQYPDGSRGYCTDTDKQWGIENLDFQIKNKGAIILKDVLIPSPEEVKTKYPKICALVSRVTDNPTGFIRDYLYFSPFGLTSGFLEKIQRLKNGRHN